MSLQTHTLLSLLLFGLISIHITSAHKCIHDELEWKPEFIEVAHEDDYEFEGRVLQTYQNIRILFDYSTFDGVTPEFDDYIRNTIIVAVENFWEAALKVVPVSGNLTGQKQTTMCNNSITVPSIYSTTGVPADLVLFVDTVDAPTQDFVAYAGPCLMSQKNSRPLFGRIVFNTAKVVPTNNTATIERDITVSLHETTHALGFTNGLYNYYVNPSTNAQLKNHTFTQIVNGQNITVLNLDPLTTRLRNYFNCPTLTGAYLENEGGSGSKNSHFERRIFYNEYMTASTLQDVRVSEFALALLEGTGWYQAVYSMAEPTTYGKNEGCDFLNTPCINSNTLTPSFPEFCSSLTATGCSWTGRGAGACGTSSIKTSSTLNSAVDYYKNKTVLGDTFSDNCPTFSIFSNLDCEDASLQAKATLSTNEFYGIGSKCFTGTLYKQGATISQTGYCFKPTCQLQADQTYTLTVAVGGNTVTCASKGSVTVSGFTGKMDCPDPNAFCTRINAEGYCRRGCTARGNCVNKQCQCFDGWTGYDCSKRTYTDNCQNCVGGDPLKTSCFGDTCECNPSNNTCMCKLGLKTGSDCVTSNPEPTTQPTGPSTSTNTTTQTNTTTTPTNTNTTTNNPTPTNNSTQTNTTTTPTNTNTTTNTPTQPTNPTSPTNPTPQPTTNTNPAPNTNGGTATDGGNRSNQNNTNAPDNGNNIGLVVGVIIGVVVLVVAVFFVVRYARRFIRSRRASKTAPIKKSGSFANPTLKRQMTNNQSKYAYVP